MVDWEWKEKQCLIYSPIDAVIIPYISTTLIGVVYWTNTIFVELLYVINLLMVDWEWKEKQCLIYSSTDAVIIR